MWILNVLKKYNLFMGNTKFVITYNSMWRRYIVGKTNAPKDFELKRPPPYPYKKKGYGLFQALFDSTHTRFNENTKIICIEGLPLAGKSSLAASLADELDMLYMPQASFDTIYINPYGYDMRKLNPKLPESCRSHDDTDFYKNPYHQNTASYKIQKYMLKYERYIDALIHLLNTGQGVIVDSSVYADYASMLAMFEMGFISGGARSVYEDVKNNSIMELLRPHLIIFLNVSIKETKNRFQQTGKEHHQNSKVFETLYLDTLDNILKQCFLRQMEPYCELLIYDWDYFGIPEALIEDIEKIDFDEYTKQDKKLTDWRFHSKWDWNTLRINFTNYKERYLEVNVARYDVPELLIPAEDARKRREIWFSAPGMEYAYGFNKDQGDKKILFKM